MDTTTTPPLPISDLHRLQLNLQTLTPVSSHASICSEDFDTNHYSSHPVDVHPELSNRYSPVPPIFTSPHYQRYQRYPQLQSRQYSPSGSQYSVNHLYHDPYQQHYPRSVQYIKDEYGVMLVDMAQLPSAPNEVTAKSEPSDDGRAPMTEMDQDEVDAIIRNKRKVRDPKACYACHRRKVKCDRNLPCDSCVKRDHPELCSYERPTKKRRLALSNALAQAEGGQPSSASRVVNAGPNVTVPKEQWEKLNQELAELRAQTSQEKDDDTSVTAEEHSITGATSVTDDADREGVHAPSNQMGTMHLGSRSVLAYMIGNRTKSTQDAARSMLEHNILPNLGLDNETTTYPFVDLWSTDSSSSDVSGLTKALPEDDLCVEFWLTYKDIPCTIYPVVPNTTVFQEQLEVMLRTRAEMNARGEAIDPHRPYGVSLPWMSLLFAVLASGSQSTGRPAKERELTSQVYICCSYQALRMSNFLTHPSLDTIQALLIIGNALSYNMNPGVSYVLLGMTLRSAISMGLHVSSSNHTENESYLRSRIWWALAWQDSHFSVSYDRPSSSILCNPNLPLTKTSTPGTRSYVESMTSIIRLTQEILRDRISNPKLAMSWSMITKYRDEVMRIWSEAMPRLTDRDQCILITDHLERLALQIHCSYLISEICRPALKEDNRPMPTSNPVQLDKQSPTISSATRRKSSLSSASPGISPSDMQIMSGLRADCVKYLVKTVETYVELRQISKYAARSWIGIQRSISAAFLLGVLPETRQEPRTITLLQELENGIRQAATEDSGFATKDVDMTSPVDSQIRRLSLTDEHLKQQPLWVKSMTKSLQGLSQLNAALMANKSESTRNPPSSANPFVPIPQAQAAAMYHTPATSPRSGPPSAHMNMQQYPMPPFTVGQMPTPNVSMNESQFIPQMGQFTPDFNDWSTGNLAQKGLSYVPGLWGQSFGR